MDALHWAVLLIPLMLWIRKFAVWIHDFSLGEKEVGWPFRRNKRAPRGKVYSLTCKVVLYSLLMYCTVACLAMCRTGIA